MHTNDQSYIHNYKQTSRLTLNQRQRQASRLANKQTDGQTCRQIRNTFRYKDKQAEACTCPGAKKMKTDISYINMHGDKLTDQLSGILTYIQIDIFINKQTSNHAGIYAYMHTQTYKHTCNLTYINTKPERQTDMRSYRCIYTYVHAHTYIAKDKHSKTDKLADSHTYLRTCRQKFAICHINMQTARCGTYATQRITL